MTMRSAVATAVMALGLAAAGAALADADVKEIPLKDGSTLLIFKDGKMSMRDARGRVMSMKDGMQMETKDGKVFVMKGNEIWRKTTQEQFREELYRGG
jgi:hypothetical protein